MLSSKPRTAARYLVRPELHAELHREFLDRRSFEQVPLLHFLGMASLTIHGSDVISKLNTVNARGLVRISVFQIGLDLVSGPPYSLAVGEDHSEETEPQTAKTGPRMRTQCTRR